MIIISRITFKTLHPKSIQYSFTRMTGVYSLLDQNIYKSKKIKALCISPLGNELLIVEENRIGLYKIGDQLEEINESKYDLDFTVKKIISNTYGSEYFILFSNGILYKLTSDDLKLKKVSSSVLFEDIDWSKNLSAIYAIAKKKLAVIKDNNIISSYDLTEPPSYVASLDNSYQLAVGFESGNILVLSQDFKQINLKVQISDNKISSITPHLEDPHLFIGDNSGNIYSFNTISNKVDKLKTESENLIYLSSIFSKTRSKVNEYILSHSRENSIKIWNASKFEPNYKKLVEKITEIFRTNFFKLKTNESESEFLTRTNVKTSSLIFELEKQKIVDSLALGLSKGKSLIKIDGDKLILEVEPFKKVSIENAKGVLDSYLELSEIHFEINNLNSFDVKDFKIKNQIDNSMIVYNPIFDEKIKDSLVKVALIEKEKERKAIELAQQISKQEQLLKNNLTSLVQNLKEDGKINQVDLSVNSRLVKERDSTGEEELNLKIAFISKGVKAVVGAKTSDYAPGKYNLLSSPSAKTLVEFFLKSTEENLSEYLKTQTRVTFRITGSTDKSGIAGSIPYEGEFGEFKNFPYYFQGSLNGMNLNQNNGIKSNSQLGFLRTYSVRNFIENYTDLFDLTKNKFIHYSEESDMVGAEYRKIQIEITIHSIDKLLGLKSGNEVSLSDVDVDIPISKRKVNGYALIIGNEDYASYQSDLDVSQNVPFANPRCRKF